MTLAKLDSDPPHLFHAASHILGAVVEADRPLRVRRSRILASRGDLQFWHESDDLDDELRSRAEQEGWGNALGDPEFTSAMKTRLEIDVAGDLALTGNLKLHQASGVGEIWLGHEGGDVSVFHLDDDELVVLSQGEVLAHDDTITARLESCVPEEMMLVRNTTYAWILSGAGHLATATPGETILLEVTEHAPVVVEAEGLLGYTAGIELTAPADYEQRAAMRGVKWLLKNIPEVDLSTSRERIWMVANGTGHVIIRSGD